MANPVQNPLGFSVRGDDNLESFIAADGIIDLLTSVLFSDDKAFASVFVHGPSGSGKTHLLNGLARLALSQGLALNYLDFRSLNSGCQVEGLAAGTLVICDGIDAQLAASGSEDGLWTFFINAEARALRLLFSAKHVPSQVFTRPELASRFAGHLLIDLECLDEAGLRRMLSDKIERRGLIVSDGTLDYLINHASRDATRLADIVVALDELCQARHRARITIPALKEILSSPD